MVGQALAGSGSGTFAARDAVADEGGRDLMDEQAFQALYRQTARPLWAYLSRSLDHQADADDLLQETFLRLLRSKPATSDAGELRAMLYRIACNLIIDRARRAKRERTHLERAGAAEPRTAPDAALRLDMERTFRQLRPQARAMMWLAHVEGASHREIAEALGVSERSVRVLLFRARKRLAALLRASGAGRGER